MIPAIDPELAIERMIEAEIDAAIEYQKDHDAYRTEEMAYDYDQTY